MRHALSETLSGLRRHAGMTVAIVVTTAVSLALLGVGLLTAQQVDLIKGRWYDRIEITVFLCAPDSAGDNCTPGANVTDEQREAIRTLLEAHPEVAQVFHQGKEDVFVEFSEAYSDSPILDTMTAADMQEVFRVKLADPTNYAGVVALASTQPGVQAVQDLRGVLEPLFDALGAARWASLGASALLLLAAALQIGNTIRMAAFARRRELGSCDWWGRAAPTSCSRSCSSRCSRRSSGRRWRASPWPDCRSSSSSGRLNRPFRVCRSSTGAMSAM